MANYLPCLKLILIVKCHFSLSISTNNLVKFKFTKRRETWVNQHHFVKKKLRFLQLQYLFFFLLAIDKLLLCCQWNSQLRYNFTCDDIRYLRKLLWVRLGTAYFNLEIGITTMFLLCAVYLTIKVLGVKFFTLGDRIVTLIRAILHFGFFVLTHIVLETVDLVFLLKKLRVLKIFKVYFDVSLLIRIESQSIMIFIYTLFIIASSSLFCDVLARRLLQLTRIQNEHTLVLQFSFLFWGISFSKIRIIIKFVRKEYIETIRFSLITTVVYRSQWIISLHLDHLAEGSFPSFTSFPNWATVGFKPNTKVRFRLIARLNYNILVILILFLHLISPDGLHHDVLRREWISFGLYLQTRCLYKLSGVSDALKYISLQARWPFMRHLLICLVTHH